MPIILKVIMVQLDFCHNPQTNTLTKAKKVGYFTFPHYIV